MSKLKSILITCAGLLLVASCTTTQKTYERQTARSDTSYKHTRTEYRDTAVISTRIVKDTTIYVPTRIIADTVDSREPGAKVKRQNGATLITNVLPDGRVAINASCDSLIFVLAGQIQELNYWRATEQSKADSMDLKSRAESNNAKVETKASGPLGISFGGWLGILFLITVLGLRLFYKP